MKLFLLSLGVILYQCLDLLAAPINSYPELAFALRSGNRFVILVDLQQCTGKLGMPFGYMIPKAMMLVPATETAAERVVTSDLHFSDHSGAPVYEYVKFTFNSDNSVNIRTTFYEASTFTAKGTSHTINGVLGKGVEIQSNRY